LSLSFCDQDIVDFIANASSKINFGALKRHFCRPENGDAELLKSALSRLFDSGKLSYINQFGQTWIDVSYDSAQRISDHIVVKPPLLSFSASSEIHVVDIEKGSAFGRGEHPTTRLCVRLLDAKFYQANSSNNFGEINAIDIGTGSGVLAVVAAKLGIGHITAIDSDPCAIFEAQQNVSLNGLQTKISVTNKGIEMIGHPLSLAIANLRTPTLLSLCDKLMVAMVEDSALLFSGMKIEEVSLVAEKYIKCGFALKNSVSEKGWGAIYLARGRFSAILSLPDL